MSVSDKHISWLLPLSASIVGAVHYILLHYTYHIDNNAAIADSVISVVLLVIALWGVGQSIRLYPTRVGITLYSLVSAVVFSLSAVFISTYIISWWVDPSETEYLHFLNNSGPVRYIMYWLFCSWAATFIALNKHTITIERQFKNYSDTTTLLKEAELFKLRQQLQPHFLYNSLNSISALTMIEPAKAQEMIGMLSDFLRNSVQREAKEQIPLQEELDYLRNYLSIESIRFGDRLNVEFSVADIDNTNMPPFLLQPLLENAIKFGLYGTTGQVTISVNIFMQHDILILKITNPFSTDNAASPRGTGFGLAGVSRRLQLIYGRTDLLETTKNDRIFTTILKIPQQHVQGNTD